MNAIVLSPLLTSGVILSGDKRAALQAHRAVHVLNPDLILARARRMALRSLPQFGSLPCGCHQDGLCRHAAILFLGAVAANTREEKLYVAEFIQHRRHLHPAGASLYPRLRDPAARAAALRDLRDDEQGGVQ